MKRPETTYTEEEIEAVRRSFGQTIAGLVEELKACGMYERVLALADDPDWVKENSQEAWEAERRRRLAWAQPPISPRASSAGG